MYCRATSRVVVQGVSCDFTVTFNAINMIPVDGDTFWSSG